MPWSPEQARRRFGAARFARLASVTPVGAPHLVPVTFVVTSRDGVDSVWHAVDGKPKTTRALQRLRNIELEPRVSLLVDHEDDDWSALWWVRADGRATTHGVDDPRAAGVLEALARRYPAYREQVPLGPLVRVEVERWVSWSAS